VGEQRILWVPHGLVVDDGIGIPCRPRNRQDRGYKGNVFLNGQTLQTTRLDQSLILHITDQYSVGILITNKSLDHFLALGWTELYQIGADATTSKDDRTGAAAVLAVFARIFHLATIAFAAEILSFRQRGGVRNSG
jgi:hypothetical protein